MEIKHINHAGLSQLLALYDQFDRPPSPRPDASVSTKILYAIESAGGCVLGAFDSEKLLGSCTVNLCSNLTWSGRPYAMIENVIVDANCRRKGVGTQLLKNAVEFAKTKDCYKVALMTGAKDAGTLAFYESSGFSQSKRGFQIRFNS